MRLVYVGWMLVDFTHKYNVFVFSTDTRFPNFHLHFEQRLGSLLQLGLLITI